MVNRDFFFLVGGGVVGFLEEVEGDGGRGGEVFWVSEGCLGKIGVGREEGYRRECVFG